VHNEVPEFVRCGEAVPEHVVGAVRGQHHDGPGQVRGGEGVDGLGGRAREGHQRDDEPVALHGAYKMRNRSGAQAPLPSQVLRGGDGVAGVFTRL